jgi:hypothetical protein
MNFTKRNRGIGSGSWVFVALLAIIFIFMASEGYSQIDSRNQIRPDREKNFEDPDKKERKRIKSKRNPRFTGKKAYSNRKQLKRSRKDRERQVDRSTKGDITGRKITTKRTPRRTYARPQDDPYKNRRIRTERSRAGAPVAPPRTATKKGERARTGDISGQKRVRQKSVRTERVSGYPQPNPYVGRKIRTEKSRAKSNKREIRSIRSATKPSESRKPRSQSRPVTATAAPKVKTKRNVYRNHERRGGERSTNKDIAGKKLRTKNTRSAGHMEGGGVLTGIDRYEARPRNDEGERYRKTRRPATPRSVTRPPETSPKLKGSVYASRKNSRSRIFTGAKKAKKVRSLSQPSRKGEKTIFGGKYNAGSVRSVSGYTQARSRKGPGTPISLSGRRKRYKQKNTYLGKDRHFGENSSTKDIAGRNLRTRNYKSYNPRWDAKKFRPYSRGSGRLTSEYSSAIPRSSRRAGWNNSGVPLQGRGRNANSEAISGYKGKMRASGVPSYGRGPEGAYKGKMRASGVPSYGRGPEGAYKGKMRSSGIPGYGRGPEGAYKGKMRSSGISGYGRGPEGAYKGKMRASGISGYGRGPEGAYKGKMRASGVPRYGRGQESFYSGRKKAKKPLVGGGSITRGWNNGGVPLMKKGRNANNESIAGYKGKMPISAMPNYSKSREGSYAGNMKAKKPLKGGGSITRRWNNNGEPLVGKGRNANSEAISGYRGRMPISAMPSYGKSKEGVYAGKMKAKKPLKGGGGSITRHWNNKEEPLIGRGQSGTDKDRLVYQGNMKAKKKIKGGGGSITRQWNNKGEPIEGKGRTATDEDILAYQGKMRAAGRGDIGPSEGMNRGRTKSLSFIRLGDPTHMGLHKEAHNKKVNNRLPKELSRKERLRMKGADGLDNGKSRAFTFWAIGDPTHGGLLRSPSQAKGRLHPSSSYTASNKSRNSIEEKEQPVKLKIWWAKLFKKNSNQPDSVKEKPKRPRYDKDERSIWETAERPDWYNN